MDSSLNEEIIYSMADCVEASKVITLTLFQLLEKASVCHDFK